MSGIKPQALTEFYWHLHNRGVTTADLAARIGVSGGAVRRLISGHRRRMGPTWENLQKILTASERILLAEVEQSATWNKRQPVWRRSSEIADGGSGAAFRPDLRSPNSVLRAVPAQ